MGDSIPFLGIQRFSPSMLKRYRGSGDGSTSLTKRWIVLEFEDEVEKKHNEEKKVVSSLAASTKAPQVESLEAWEPTRVQEH